MHSIQLLAVLMAYLFDLAIGDPPWRWHPVRIIGRFIEKMEKILNVKGLNKKFSGFTFLILVVGVTIFCVAGILKLSNLVHPVFYFVIYTLLIYFAIAVKSLAKEADKVHQALVRDDIAQARKNLSMIVARDTQQMDKPEIIRATVETVAESTMDGIVSPLFYAFLGGPILAWAYKAVNTLDSMVGYNNERFARFGYFSAKADSLLNFIPSKITSFIILISGWCCGNFRGGHGRWILKYFFKGHRYNSEATEAVMASVLGVQLGGVNFYNSVPVKKNLIGEGVYPLQIRHITDSINIAYMSSALFIMIGMSLYILTINWSFIISQLSIGLLRDSAIITEGFDGSCLGLFFAGTFVLPPRGKTALTSRPRSCLDFISANHARSAFQMPYSKQDQATCQFGQLSAIFNMYRFGIFTALHKILFWAVDYSDFRKITVISRRVFISVIKG